MLQEGNFLKASFFVLRIPYFLAWLGAIADLCYTNSIFLQTDTDKDIKQTDM